LVSDHVAGEAPFVTNVGIRNLVQHAGKFRTLGLVITAKPERRPCP